MLDLAGHRAPSGDDSDTEKQVGFSQYDLPAMFHASPRKVLVVGAGSGNDVAGLLRNGCTGITAVDIDPVIIDLGREYHPERPYASPDVRVINDDARSFFATTKDRYDLVVFGLLDAHSGTSMTNTRLDHYVYTQESLQRARALLAEGGTLVLTFEILQPFIPERIFETLSKVFGHDPLYFRIPRNELGWGGVMFVISNHMTVVENQLSTHPPLADQIDQWKKLYTIPRTNAIDPATDDWPYLYLDTPHIPGLFFVVFGVLVVLFARGSKRLTAGQLLLQWKRVDWHFFFLGAGFLLLEVQNISKASLVLGSTWQVNAVIISGVLAFILIANLIAAKFPNLPIWTAYFLLCGSCVGLYFLDLSLFSSLPYATKAAMVGIGLCLPMLFSGIIFIRSFVFVAHKDAAMGANLFGSLIGGMMQWLTFLTGIKALLLVVVVIYISAWFCRPRAA